MIEITQEEALKFVEKIYKNKPNSQKLLSEAQIYLTKLASGDKIYVTSPLNESNDSHQFIISKVNKESQAKSSLTINSLGVFKSNITEAGRDLTDTREHQLNDDTTLLTEDNERDMNQRMLSYTLTRQQMDKNQDIIENSSKIKYLSSKKSLLDKDDKIKYQQFRREIYNTKNGRPNNTFIYEELATMQDENGDYFTVYRDGMTDEEKVFLGENCFDIEKAI